NRRLSTGRFFIFTKRATALSAKGQSLNCLGRRLFLTKSRKAQTMNSANLQLSPEELRLVSDPGWILTKNSIVAKAVGIMAGLAETYREVWAAGGGWGEGGRGVIA